MSISWIDVIWKVRMVNISEETTESSLIASGMDVLCGDDVGVHAAAVVALQHV